MNLEPLLDLTIELAEDAGKLLLGRFGEEVGGISTKASPTDVVSDADRESESLIVDKLQTSRPNDGILAEEGDDRPSKSGVSWIVDPLDGTVNYLFGIPLWAVSIASVDAEGTAVAVVHDPNQQETFSAARGGGCRLNHRRVSVSETADLSRALIGTGFAYEAKARKAQARRLPVMLPLVRDIRRAGSAALDLSWLACGRLDGFFEAPMKKWDRAAGELLVKEAGGVVRDLAPPYGDDTGVIAANPNLFDRLRQLVTDSAG
ncbi:MAG: inositol monophosphatase [Actinomycetota bacterium]|nr:inositol monophosphatase [Actinomycetota bacterium]